MTLPISIDIQLLSFPFPTWVRGLISWLTSSYHQTQDDMEKELKVIEMCKQNPNYFEAIYEKYYEQVFFFILKRIDDDEWAADVASMVFMKCLKNIHKYEYRGVPFSAWLYRIALNEVNQFFRKKKNADRTVQLESSHMAHLFEEMEWKENNQDLTVLLQKLMECLKPDDIQYIELRFFENYSFKEIGYMLGVTEVNAKVKTYRLLKRMRQFAEKTNVRVEEQDY